MKKFFVAVLLLISVGSFAITPGKGEKVSPQLQAALEKEFAGAQYIVWQSLKEHSLYHAKFVYNNEQVNAFFEENGNLLAIGRYINPAVMPLTIIKNLHTKYGEYKIIDAIEYSRSGETSYVVSLENEKTSVVLEAYSSGNLYLFKKEKKNFSAKL
jgi:hypothetical protein